MTLIAEFPPPPAWIGTLPHQMPDWVTDRPACPWNLAGMLKAWEAYPLSMDYLRKDSPNHHFLGLQTQLYQHLLTEVWEELAPGSAILDAACGIGRFLLPLSAMGHRLLGLDACRPSLEAAERHLLKASKEASPADPWRDPELWHCDLNGALQSLRDRKSFDLILAIEFLSYVDSMEAAVEKLTSLLRPGGLFVASVEAWPGGFLADPSGLDAAGRARAEKEHLIEVEGDRWVRLIDASQFASILDTSGLSLRWIRGTHFLPDGPQAAELDLDRVGDLAYNQDVVAREDQLRRAVQDDIHPRALLAVAQRPR